MTGIDIPIPECQLIMHQPTLKEISYIGEEAYFRGAQYLCLNSSMYKDLVQEGFISNFAVFMMVILDETQKEKKQDVKEVLTLLFPSYQIIFTPRSILFNREGENLIIDEGNFEDLQKVLRQVFCLSNAAQDAFNPANEAAKAIADKLMKARQRVAAEKNKGNNGSIFAQYLSVLTVGLSSMSLFELMDLTPFQLYDLVERYMLYVNWDLDIRSRLAGGSSESKPDNWMKIIH